MRYSIGNRYFCHHVDIKVTIHFSSSWEVSFVFTTWCPYISLPNYGQVANGSTRQRQLANANSPTYNIE